ncbi:MAG: deoxyuridine 5'-triphosphate nucleotidohydrolase [Clostridiales bacterium]|nr:deoxyuridine 5'-triphosphate nucleotidohydrolase [Clostridiales bacterium]
MQIEVMYHSDTEKITVHENGDWLDLRAAERVEFKAGEHKLISLGVSMRLPAGYEAHVAPRSSTFKHWGLLQTNSPGIIDESYAGPEDIWFFSAYATRDTVVEKNERICQFRLVEKMPRPQIQEVDYLNSPKRGGYGSSGRV